MDHWRSYALLATPMRDGSLSGLGKINAESSEELGEIVPPSTTIQVNVSSP